MRSKRNLMRARTIDIRTPLIRRGKTGLFPTTVDLPRKSKTNDNMSYHGCKMTGVMFRAPRGLLNRAKDHRCGPARYQLSQFPFRCTWDKSHRELPGAAYGAAGQRLVNVRASSRSGQPALQPEHGSPPA